MLDCVTPHDFSSQADHLMNLQHYVIARQYLPEMEALTIFYHTMVVVHGLHERDIVHRDLKLGNLVVERLSGKVVLTNLCLGQFLMPGMPKLQDQRGSPAYISPDVLSALPYKGKKKKKKKKYLEDEISPDVLSALPYKGKKKKKSGR